jgi:hypothetical protein
MVFPVGGDFDRLVEKPFKVYKSDRRICRHDNGTDICDLGHKLKFPGTCLNQAIGTFNSTDATFQPTFPVCETDYVSQGFNGGTLLSSDEYEGQHTSASIGGLVSDSFNEVSVPSLSEGNFKSHNLSLSINDAGTLALVDSTVTGNAVTACVLGTVSSFWKMAQFNPGVLPHGEGIYSDLYYLDVFSSIFEYNRTSIHSLEYTYGKIRQTGNIDIYGNVVQTDYYTTISGSVDVCEGDEEPPFITYLDPPASGTSLRPINQIVDFRLSDPLTGVSLSSIDVSLNSTTTTGTIVLVTAGADQTGGLVSITGDSTSYRIRYLPDYFWVPNDRVLVTISGSDQVPLVEGNPFFCGASEVNHFGGDITFSVAEEDNLTASITVVGDVTPPYLDNLVPASGTSSNSVFSPVVIDISDDLTGVELSSVNVTVNGETIVLAGASITTEATVAGTPSSYTVTYNKSTAFDYGSTIDIIVYAEDKVSPSPNILSTTYDVSYIEDTTLIIENFLPPVGTSVNTDKVNISVDIRDDSHDINSDLSFLVVNNTIVSGTVTTLTSGINIEYHPPNDFAFDEPIVVKVHAQNGNIASPAVKEAFYTLFYGCRVQLHQGGPYEHAQNVDVLVKARNIENLHKDLSTGYLFTSYTQPSSDFGASIQAINPVADLPASLNVIGPFHRYGQDVTVSFYVKDLEGRELGPYVFTYTIEDSPS